MKGELNMKSDNNKFLLYAVTDRSFLKNETLIEQVEKSLKGGVTCVQLREKNSDYDLFLQEAFEIKELCRKYNALFIVNDNVDIGIKVKADGVHIGQNDMDVLQVRKLVGEEMIIGVSVQTTQQAVLAEKSGADYLGVGAVFETASKKDAIMVSYDTLKEISQNVSIPIVAIGGINRNNIYKLKNSGISGVALISAIFGAEDIKGECEKLKKSLEEIL